MNIEDIKLIFREDRIPAAFVEGYAVSPHQGLFAAAWDRPEFSSSESTRRLVACWNACQGIETETLERNWPAGGLLPCADIHEKAELSDKAVIALGKYASGYRPGTDGWTMQDQEALEVALGGSFAEWVQVEARGRRKADSSLALVGYTNPAQIGYLRGHEQECLVFTKPSDVSRVPVYVPFQVAEYAKDQPEDADTIGGETPPGVLAPISPASFFCNPEDTSNGD